MIILKNTYTTKLLSSPFGAKEASRLGICFLGFGPWTRSTLVLDRVAFTFSLSFYFSPCSRSFLTARQFLAVFLFDDIKNPFPSLPGSSFSFPTYPARGTRFTLHQEISHGPHGFYIAFSLIFCWLASTWCRYSMCSTKARKFISSCQKILTNLIFFWHRSV